MATDDALPHGIYMSLYTDMKLSRIATLFASQGWETRMCSWTEYEIASNDSELVLMPASTTLLSGGISRNSNTIDRILATLDAASILYSYEIYDENGLMFSSKLPPVDSDS